MCLAVVSLFLISPLCHGYSKRPANRGRKMAAKVGNQNVDNAVGMAISWFVFAAVLWPLNGGRSGRPGSSRTLPMLFVL